MNKTVEKTSAAPKKFKRKCRACLKIIYEQKYVDMEDLMIIENDNSSDSDSHAAYTSKNSEEQNISFLQAFNDCTQLQVRLHQAEMEENSLDWSLESFRYLCIECGVELKNAYQFVMKARFSNDSLWQQLQQCNIKVEEKKNACDLDEEMKVEFININSNIDDEVNEIQVELLSDTEKEQLKLFDTLEEELSDPKQSKLSSLPRKQQVENTIVAIFGTNISETQSITENVIFDESPDNEENTIIECKNENEEEYDDTEDATSVEVRLIGSDAEEPYEEDDVAERQHTLQFKCELCTAIYDMQRELVQHYEQDHDQRDFNFSCSLCEHRFFSKSALNVHVRQIHQNCEFIDCSYCGRTVLKSFFKMHHRRHTHQKKFLCFECPSTFTSKYTLKKHLLTHAKDRNRNIECDICGRKFYTIESFRTHQIIHQDPKDRETYSCSLCEKTFMRQTNLKLHMQMHRGETIDCSHCGKKFVRRKDLEIHIRFHTGDFPFACSSCDKRFAIKSHLNAHERKHKGIKYQCTVCNKQFLNRAGLRQHSFEHTGMPLCCGICQRGFPTKFKVRRHLRSVHHNLFPLGYKDDDAEKYVKELESSNCKMAKSGRRTKTNELEITTVADLAENEETYEMLEMLDDNEDDYVAYLVNEI